MHLISIRWIGWIIPLVLFSNILSGQIPIPVSKMDSELRVPYKHILTIEDSSSNLTFDDILILDKQSKFLPDIYRVDHSSSAYWLKFTFVGEALKNQSWFLEGRDPNTMQIDFYIPNREGGYSVSEMGLERPFQNRQIAHKNFVAELPNHSDTLTVFVRIKSRNHTNFLFRLKSADFLMGYSLTEYVLLGLFYGIIFIMALYNLVLYLFVKEPLYIWYVLYVLAGALTCLIEDGLGFQYLWPSFQGFNYVVEFIAGCVFLIAFLFYADAFLEISSRRPKMFKLIRGVTAASILFLFFYQSFDIHSSLIAIYTLPQFFVFLTAISLYREGYVPAKYFLLAVSTVMLSLLILFLNKVNGFAWTNMSDLVIILLVYAFNIALVFEVFILSFGQAQKLWLFQKHQQRNLEESESRFKGIFQASFDAILVYDFKQQRILNVNKRAEQLFMFSAQEFLTLKLKDLIQLSTSLKEHLLPNPDKLQIQKYNIFEEATGMKKNGESFDCEFTIGQLPNSRESFSVVAVKDISRRKIAERNLENRIEEIKEKNDKLEKYVASNLELQNFVYVASHDIKQPLRTIKSFSQLIKKRLEKNAEQDATVKEYLDFIISGSLNLESMIHNLLEHSKVNKVGDFTFQPVNVSNIIEQVKLALTEQIKDNNAKIILDNLPVIFAESTRMSQLFQNLISNAIKFRKESEPCLINIRAHSEECHWTFSVSDNGVGIPEAKKELVFDLFTQLNPKGAYEGYGIGLSICKKIVEIHEGKIWIESTLGLGTTVYFTIKKDLGLPVAGISSNTAEFERL